MSDNLKGISLLPLFCRSPTTVQGSLQYINYADVRAMQTSFPIQMNEHSGGVIAVGSLATL